MSEAFPPDVVLYQHLAFSSSVTEIVAVPVVVVEAVLLVEIAVIFGAVVSATVNE